MRPMQDQNPYAPPKSEILDIPEMGGVWRKDKILVMLRDAELPHRCIYCNEETSLTKRRQILYLNPWLQLLVVVLFLLFNILALVPIIIIFLIFRKKAKIDIPVCGEHWKKRVLLVSATLLALLASIGLAIVAAGGGSSSEYLLIASLSTFVVAAILSVITGQLLRSKLIDKELIMLKGAKPPFLDSLPDYEAQ